MVIGKCKSWEISSAVGAGSEEFEFVVEVLVAGFLADFVFEVVDGAGCFDGFDFSAAGADEVVAVCSGLDEGEVGGAFVEAEAADDAVGVEALEEAVDGGFVAEVDEAGGGG